MADLNDTNKLGTYHISSDIQNYESARSNFFTLIIDDFADLDHNLPNNLVYPEFSYTGENQDNEYIANKGKTPQEIIKLSVNKMFVPHFSLGQIEIRRGNSIVKFTDVPSWESGTIELQDFVGLETKNILMAWQALAYDVVSDTQGRAGNWQDEDGIWHRGYKRNCTLVEYTPDFEQIRYWTLIGCWISNITESNFEVDGQGARSLSITLQYDRAIMKQPDKKWAAKE